MNIPAASYMVSKPKNNGHCEERDSSLHSEQAQQSHDKEPALKYTAVSVIFQNCSQWINGHGKQACPPSLSDIRQAGLGQGLLSYARNDRKECCLNETLQQDAGNYQVKKYRLSLVLKDSFLETP